MTDAQHFYDSIARYYDAENESMTDDLALYSDFAERSGGPILEIGCGTGRVLFHLADQGHQVAGLDISDAMLNRGRRKLANRVDLRDLVTFYEGDALNYSLPDKYALIIFSYNCLMHFKTLADQQAVLKRMGSFLTENGLLVIDLPNAGETFAALDDGAVTLERTFIEPDSGHLVMQQSVSTLDRAEQLQDITWIYDEIAADGVVRRTLAPLTLRYIFPAELDLLLQLVGLRRITRYGDYDASAFVDGCPRLIVLAGKPTAKPLARSKARARSSSKPESLKPGSDRA